MRHSIKIGFSFGLTSGIITTLGLMVGLYSSTNSMFIVIGGILTIAIADAFSDALGIHISEESENHHTSREIWESTLSTFLTKFFFALTFIVPVLLFQLQTAIIAAVIWGLGLLTVFSYIISKQRKANPWKAIAEHLVIAVIVILMLMRKRKTKPSAQPQPAVQQPQSPPPQQQYQPYQSSAVDRNEPQQQYQTTHNSATLPPPPYQPPQQQPLQAPTTNDFLPTQPDIPKKPQRERPLIIETTKPAKKLKPLKTCPVCNSTLRKGKKDEYRCSECGYKETLSKRSS